MQKFEVTNTNLEEAEMTRTALEQMREAGLQPIEGELKKTEEDGKMIEEVNQLLGIIAERFHIEIIPIEPDSIHFLPAKIFEDYTGHEIRGLYYVKTGCILLNDDLLRNKSERVDILIHESLHMLSHHKFLARDDNEIIAYRGGYEIEPTHKEYDRLEGLNEMVVVQLERILMSIYADKFGKEYNFTEEDFSRIERGGIYGDLLSSMIKKIADQKGENYATVADRFLKGHFTGEMLHLKDIEKVYGPRSLRILAMLDDGHDPNPEMITLREMVLGYFREEDALRREKMTEGIFNQFDRWLQSARKETEEPH